MSAIIEHKNAGEQHRVGLNAHHAIAALPASQLDGDAQLYSERRRKPRSPSSPFPQMPGRSTKQE